MSSLRFPVVLFDWGDTVMEDDPSSFAPMVEWPQVRAVEGIAEVLAHLQASGRRCMLATSANISNERQIRGALARAGLDSFFERIFSTSSTGLPKGEAFYRLILQELALDPSQALMVGDFFEKDVLIPNSLGMHAVWYNPRTSERRTAELHTTVGTMGELLEYFQNL